MKKILIILIAFAMFFSVFGNVAGAAGKAKATSKTGVTKIVKVGSNFYGYKYDIYLDNDKTKKLVSGYKVSAGSLGLPYNKVPHLGSVIMWMFAGALAYEAPHIAKHNKGKGVIITVTIPRTWTGIPFVHGYKTQK